MYSWSYSESDYFFMKHVFFHLTINRFIGVIVFIEGLDLVSKPIREIKKFAILVVAKISTWDQKYKSTSQMAFELKQ